MKTLLFLIALAAATVSASDVLTVRLPKGALQPRVVSAASGSSAVVFLQGDPKACEVRVATLSSGGALSSPERVSTSASKAVALGTVRGPAIAVGAKDVRHVLWHGANGSARGGKGSALFYARVGPTGKPTAPLDMMGETSALDGGAAVAADGSGHVWLVWHALPAGKDGEAARRLFIRQSTDNGTTFTEPWPIAAEDLGICGCCGLAASTDASGALQILYRAAENSQQRGARLIRLPANATASNRPELIQQDRWDMPGCPMTTASFAPGPTGLITTWVTAYQLRFDGLNVSAPATKAAQNHPRLARNADGETLLVWTEGTAWGKGGDLVAQMFSTAEVAVGSPSRTPLPAWTYGACTTLPDGRFVVMY